MDVVNETKWSRRRNLEGVNLRLVALETAPYINKMVPLAGKPGEFEMEGGMFADVLFGLRVCTGCKEKKDPLPNKLTPFYIIFTTIFKNLIVTMNSQLAPNN